MARALFEKMQDELDDLGFYFNSLCDEFRQSGDDEVFVDLSNKLVRLKDKAQRLSDPEERFEILSNINALFERIDTLIHSAF